MRGAGRPDQAIFVAVRRADGSVLVLGRSLSEINDLRETVARALALALAPTTILILVIGASSPVAPSVGSATFTPPSPRS
jgi:hypothetical protein